MAVIATLIVMIWGWRKFRHGGVIIEGTGVEKKSVLKSSLGLLLTGRKDQVMQDMLDGKLPT